MSKTGSIILKCTLGLLIVFLAVMIFLCVNRPQQRESDYYVRRDACGEKLKVIRTLEEAHKITYGTYCGDFDTLLLNLSKPEQRIIRKVIAPNAPDSVSDMPESEQIRRGWLIMEEAKVVPLDKLREDKKLTLTDEELADVIYVPFTHKQKKFVLKADSVSASASGEGGKLPTFEAYVTLDDLYSDYTNEENNSGFHKFVEIFTGSDAQWLINKKATLIDMGRFCGWKVGDITSATTESNFE